jgi:hypothetical protein
MATGFRFPNRNDNIVLLYQKVIHQNEFALFMDAARMAQWWGGYGTIGRSRARLTAR